MQFAIVIVGFRHFRYAINESYGHVSTHTRDGNVQIRLHVDKDLHQYRITDEDKETQMNSVQTQIPNVYEQLQYDPSYQKVSTSKIAEQDRYLLNLHMKDLCIEGIVIRTSPFNIMSLVMWKRICIIQHLFIDTLDSNLKELDHADLKILGSGELSLTNKESGTTFKTKFIIIDQPLERMIFGAPLLHDMHTQSPKYTKHFADKLREVLAISKIELPDSKTDTMVNFVRSDTKRSEENNIEDIEMPILGSENTSERDIEYGKQKLKKFNLCFDYQYKFSKRRRIVGRKIDMRTNVSVAEFFT